MPVAPAAHYTMGGIRTDLDGRSTLAGLYAVGECACNGLHGANRLASNSLAECFVFGRRSALAALDEPALPADPGPAAGAGTVARSTAGRRGPRCGSTPDSSATREGLSASAATRFRSPDDRGMGPRRRESRGAHQRTDHPETDPALDGTHSVVGARRAVPRSEAWR